MIANLNQFKKAMKEGKKFEIVQHYVHKEYVGQVRLPNKVQTNSVYTLCVNEHPYKSKVNNSNDGKGIWLEYKSAKNWDFSKEEIVYYKIYELSGIKNKSKVMVIRMVE